MNLSGFYHLISYSQHMKDFSEDIYIAAKQISQYVIGSQYIEVNEKYTYHDLENRDMSFQLDENRIVKTPGFEIILTNIDSLYFFIEHDYIYMNVQRNEKEYKFLLTYAKPYLVEDINDENQ